MCVKYKRTTKMYFLIFQKNVYILFVHHIKLVQILVHISLGVLYLFFLYNAHIFKIFYEPVRIFFSRTHTLSLSFVLSMTSFGIQIHDQMEVVLYFVSMSLRIPPQDILFPNHNNIY